MEITLSVTRRLLSGKPIGSADKGHIHHRLMKWGWSAPMVCGAALLICALASITAVAVRLHYHGVASVMVLFGGILFVLMLHFCGFLDLFHPKSIKGNRPHFLIANHFISMQRIKLELARTPSEVGALVAQTCVEFGVEEYELTVVAGGERKTPLEMAWTKPPTAHGSLLLYSEVIRKTGELKRFSDKAALTSGTRAGWTFEPHISEDELDVQYRVLMSDFMRKALGCAQQLYHMQKESEPPEPKGSGLGAGMSSTALRRRGTASGKQPEVPRASKERAKVGTAEDRKTEDRNNYSHGGIA